MIEVDWVKSTSHKKAYKHEVLIKISQKARFEKNYIVWKLYSMETSINSSLSEYGGFGLRRTI